MDLIRVKNVEKKYKNGVTAIYDLNLAIEKGSFVFVIGGSGSGKSTLIKMLYREEKPTKGQVIVGGLDVAKLRNSKVYKLRRKLGIVFQDYRLLPKLTVYENVAFALECIGEKKDIIRKKVLKALEDVGLKNKVHNYPDQLSGGEQQRVAIARAIVNNPKLLLCDEPTSALDPQTTASILQLLKTINQKLNITIIMITHQMSVVEKICNKVAILSEGKVAESGQVNEVFSNPKSLAAKKLVFPEGFDDILSISSSKKMIRIVFDGQKVTEKPIIAMMSQQTGVLASISYASTKSIGGKLYGSMILTVDDSSQLTKVLDYLNSNGLIAREVNLND